METEALVIGSCSPSLGTVQCAARLQAGAGQRQLSGHPGRNLEAQVGLTKLIPVCGQPRKGYSSNKQQIGFRLARIGC